MDYIITSNGLMRSDTYLAHHGVKGMKWGVRRYEKYRSEGGKKSIIKKHQFAKAEKKEAGAYRYKTGTNYKNATTSEKRVKTNEHNTNVKTIGTKNANRVDYIQDKYDRSSADKFKKKKRRQVVAASVLATGAWFAIRHSNVIQATIQNGKVFMHNSKVYTQWGNAAVNSYSKTMGLKEVTSNKKLSLSKTYKHVKAGKKFYDKIMG